LILSIVSRNRIARFALDRIPLTLVFTPHKGPKWSSQLERDREPGPTKYFFPSAIKGEWIANQFAIAKKNCRADLSLGKLYIEGVDVAGAGSGHTQADLEGFIEVDHNCFNNVVDSLNP